MKNFFRTVFELLLIATIVFLGYRLYQKQGLPGASPQQSVSSVNDDQTMQVLQKLAVDMGATDEGYLSGKNALDLISDIQIKISSAQTCNSSSLNESEMTVLEDLLTGGHPETLDKIKGQNAFVKECSGAKVLILKQK